MIRLWIFWMFFAIIPIFEVIHMTTFAPDILMNQSYFGRQRSYAIDIAFGVQFLVAVYFVYSRCYVGQCISTRAYFKREFTFDKKTSSFYKFVAIPLALLLYWFIPFILSFLFASVYLKLYITIYTVFNYEKVDEYMLMKFGTASSRRRTYVVARPSKSYKLGGHLQAIGFNMKDENNSPYIIDKITKNGKTRYVPQEGYLYHLWGKKNKYGYFAYKGDYIRERRIEYTRKELERAGCKVVDGKFNCDDVRFR